MRTETISTIAMAMVSGVFIFTILYMNHSHDQDVDKFNSIIRLLADSNSSECKKKIESYKMYNGIESDAEFGINGLYFPSSQYYCVWADDREIPDITKTEVHEMCHHLINNDNNGHFCKVKLEINNNNRS